MVVPGDCRRLIFFLEDGAKSEWLGCSTREHYLEALKLDPEMVGWAIEGLKTMRPDEPVPLTEAVTEGLLRAHGGDHQTAKFTEQKKQASNTSLLPIGGDHKSEQFTPGLKPLGKRCDTTYIRARLERDGKTELLAKVIAGELSANAAAIEAGFRTRTVQIRVTVEGVARFIRKYFSEDQRRELAAEIVRGQRENA
jgi:hypothetical protein